MAKSTYFLTICTFYGQFLNGFSHAAFQKLRSENLLTLFQGHFLIFAMTNRWLREAVAP